jgi:acyl-CoA thioesterase I
MGSLSRSAALSRFVVVLFYALLIAFSLVVFPSSFPILAALWLGLASVQFVRNRSGWLPIAVCAALLVIKQPDWSPTLVIFLLLLLFSAVVLFLRRAANQTVGNNLRIDGATLAAVWMMWIAWTIMSFVGMHTNETTKLDPARPITCLGDSLTTGLTTGEAYPEYLQNLVGVPVVNWGRAGVTARDIVKHLPEIFDAKPQAVVVELGGNDFMRGHGRSATRDSLKTIIESCQNFGAAVILVEIPRGFIVDPYRGLERELARQYDLELIPDSMIRMLVVRSPAIPIVGEIAKPHLSDDGLHPNAAGAQSLARNVLGALVRLYGPEIMAQPSEMPPARSRAGRGP